MRDNTPHGGGIVLAALVIAMIYIAIFLGLSNPLLNGADLAAAALIIAACYLVYRWIVVAEVKARREAAKAKRDEVFDQNKH